MSSNEEVVDYEEETGMTVEPPAAEPVADSSSDNKKTEEEGEQVRGRGHKGNKGHNKHNKGEVKTKGRGFERRNEEENDRYDGRGGVFERLEHTNKAGPLQCKQFSL